MTNGIRAVLVNDACALYAGIAVSVRAGSRYEPDHQHGLTHLLEHLLLHKTQKYPSFIDLATELDWAVVDYDAETCAGAMTFVFETPRSSVRAAIDLIAEVILRPNFTRAVLQQEITRVIDEEHLDSDIVEPTVDDLIDESIYRGNGLAKSVSGPLDRLRTLGLKDLTDWHRSVVRSNRLAIALSGNFDPEQAERQLRLRFGRLGRGQQPTADRFDLTQQEPRLTLIEKPTGLIQVRLGFPTFGFTHPDRLVLSVLNNHLGGQYRRSSRLSIRLIGAGLAYSAWSEVWHYADAGSLILSFPVHPRNVLAALTAVREELDSLRATRLSRAQLDLTLTSLKHSARDRKYTPLVQASFFAQQLLATGTVLTSDQYILEINQIRVRDVHRVAQVVIEPQRLNAVLVGPLAPYTAADISAALGISPLTEGSEGATPSPAQA